MFKSAATGIFVCALTVTLQAAQVTVDPNDSAIVRAQANLENVLDTRYYVNADSNTNISPGAPRTLRIALTTKF